MFIRMPRQAMDGQAVMLDFGGGMGPIGAIGIVAGPLGRLAIAIDARGDIVADHVHLMAAPREFVGHPDGQVLRAAAGGIKVLDDQGDSHGSFHITSCASPQGRNCG